MGRFTSVQGFADNNSNNRTITYDQAKGNTDGKNNDNQKLVTEKVVNPYGSTSGAGSGEFHVYRHARSREMARWNALDMEAKQEQEERNFRAALEEDRIERETKASKNRKKRQREKEAKRRKKFMKAAGIDTEKQSKKNVGSEGHEEEEEFTYTPVAQQDKTGSSSDKPESSAARNSSTHKNDLVIPNDGSFLEMMKRKLQEEKIHK